MLCVGIDWSDQVLDFHVRGADEHMLAQGRVTLDAAGVADLFTRLEAHAPPTQIAVAFEACHGLWIQALLDRGYTLYPVNPACVNDFRKAISAAGCKSDRIDARVLATMLAALRTSLVPWKPDDPEIVTLRILCEDRVRLVEEHTAKINELHAVLKAYYPAFEGFFGTPDSLIALKFLQEFATQNQMRALTPRRLAGWLRRQSYTAPARLEDMQQALSQPVLPVADHLQAAKAPRIRYLATSLTDLKLAIAVRDDQIRQHFEQLPEADWIRSLPGIGDVLGPALLACLGRDPTRFADPQTARAFMGTAPITEASGKMRCVKFRRGCWKFARRTLQLFANLSRQASGWAARFYEKQRGSGHSHHAALRALAHKWLKILLAMRRSATPYQEHRFVDSQRQHALGSKLAGA